jgi:hypothetical protein
MSKNKTFNFRYSKEPMFVKKPRSSEAYEGDTVIICCEVIGDPKPDVVWLRDFLKVSGSDIIYIHTLSLCKFLHVVENWRRRIRVKRRSGNLIILP